MVFAVFAGEYRIKTVSVLPMESYPARVSVEGITIAADPYPTNDKSFTAFDIKDLNSRGYFPLHLILKNSSANYVSIRTQAIVLLTPDAHTFYATSATILVEDLVKAGFISKLPKATTHDQSTSTKTGSPLIDFTSKELRNEQIEPGSVVDGFLFFYTAAPKKGLFSGGTLIIPPLAVEGGRRQIGPFSIPLDPALNTSAAK